MTALVVAGTTGCPKSQPTEGTAGGPAAPSAVASVPTQSQAAPPTDRMIGPMKLVLKGPTPPPEKGDFKLMVDVVANEPLRKPLVMHVELPAGARLVTGTADESLTIAQAGTTTKEFTIHIDAPLTAPITVTADMKDETGGAGLHAQRKYPAPADISPPRPPPMPR